jgi:hypothetical protein
MAVNLAKIKCKQCHKKFNTNKHDVFTTAEECLDPACSLRTPAYADLMKLASKKFEEQADTREVLEIPDPIVIKVKQNEWRN